MGLQRKFLWSTAALALAFGAHPGKVAAQETPAASPQSGGGLQEVVVSANRREQSLQKVPVSITALSATTIEQQHAVNLGDIATLTPSLQIIPAYIPNNPAFAIRGQIQQDTSATLDPSVAVYLDEVYIARAAGALTDMVDVERVEVLNGPQGSLFGRNTTGGAVVLTSKRPTDEFGGWGSVSYASGGQLALKGVVNAPLVKDFALLRVAGEYVHRDGFTTNSVSGNLVDNSETAFIRSTLMLTPTNKLTVLLRGDYTALNAGGLATRMVGFNPASTSVLSDAAVEAGLPNTVAGRAQALDLLTAAVAAGNADPRTIATDLRYVSADQIIPVPGQKPTFVGGSIDPYQKSVTWGASGTAEYDLGPAQVRSITAYRGVKNDSVWDIDGSILTLIDTRYQNTQHQFSQEFIVNGNAFDRLNWSAGALYFREQGKQSNRSGTLFYLQQPATGLLGFTQAAPYILSESYAFFGQGTLNVTDQLSLTFGGRWSRDNRAIGSSTYALFQPNSYVCALPTAVILHPGVCFTGAAKSFETPTYNVALDYKFDADRMAYFHVSRGYRAGGFNARIAVASSLVPFQPEYNTEYEVGFKAAWLDRRLRTNIAYFHDDRSNIQTTRNGSLSLPIVDPGGIARTITVSFGNAANTGTAIVDGVDASVDFKATDWLTLGLAWVHMTSHYNTDDPATPFTTLPMTPEDNVVLSGTFDKELVRGVIDGTLRVDFNHRGKMFDASYATFYSYYDVRNVLNLNLTFEHIPSGVSLSAFARNVTDASYLSRTIGITGLNIQPGIEADPRTLGIEVKVPFGGR
jgi:iron complex outermembrane recepter protein